jgi:hypothetical protein
MSVTVNALENPADPGEVFNPGFFTPSQVTAVEVGWYINGQDFPNFIVNSIVSEGAFTRIGFDAAVFGNEKFQIGNPYTFSQNPATIPGQIILSKARPSQLMPLCTNGKVQIWWNAPASTGGLPLLSYSINVLNVDTGISLPAIPINNPNVNTYVIAGLTNGTNYSISISATNTFGSGPPAFYRTVQPGNKSNSPTDAVATTTKSGNTASVVVTWVSPVNNNSVGAIKNYVVEAIPFPGSLTIYKKVRFQQFGHINSILLTKDLASKVYNPSQNVYDPFLANYTYNVYAVTDSGYSLAAAATLIPPP